MKGWQLAINSTGFSWGFRWSIINYYHQRQYVGHTFAGVPGTCGSM